MQIVNLLILKEVDLNKKKSLNFETLCTHDAQLILQDVTYELLVSTQVIFDVLHTQIFV